MLVDVLIPARGNSKGVKNKNIIKINNKELIFYSINLAKKLKNIFRIIVSTDSKKIANISKKYGAYVPFLRPRKFAKDNSGDIEVFKHYVDWLKINRFKKPELIVHLRPTTPFRSVNIINRAINIIKKNNKISSLRSMRRSSFSPYKMWHINKNGFAYPVIKKKKEFHSSARQSLPSSFDHIGYIDIVRVKKTIYKNTMIGSHVFPYIICKKNLNNFVDIDSWSDIHLARKLIRK